MRCQRPFWTGVDDLLRLKLAPRPDVKGQEAYDDVKVDAVLNEIGGKASRWKRPQRESRRFSAWPPGI